MIKVLMVGKEDKENDDVGWKIYAHENLMRRTWKEGTEDRRGGEGGRKRRKDRGRERGDRRRGSGEDTERGGRVREKGDGGGQSF